MKTPGKSTASPQTKLTKLTFNNSSKKHHPLNDAWHLLSLQIFQVLLFGHSWRWCKSNKANMDWESQPWMAVAFWVLADNLINWELFWMSWVVLPYIWCKLTFEPIFLIVFTAYIKYVWLSWTGCLQIDNLSPMLVGVSHDAKKGLWKIKKLHSSGGPYACPIWNASIYICIYIFLKGNKYALQNQVKYVKVMLTQVYQLISTTEVVSGRSCQKMAWTENNTMHSPCCVIVTDSCGSRARWNGGSLDERKLG